MPGRWRKIEWHGLHTKKDFLERVHREYHDRMYLRMRGDREIPHGMIKRNDLEGWMALVGARWS